MSDLQFHDIANWFPLLDDRALQELAADIKAHGLHESIKVFQGKILDGRNRYLACAAAGVTPTCEDVNPPDPVAFVFSRNFHRRDLTPSQRAMLGDKARAHYAEQARQRQEMTQIKDGQPPVVEKCAPPEKHVENGKSRDQAARAVGVSNRTVDKARAVRENGVRELQQAVEQGKLDVSKAAKLAALPRETQETLMVDAAALNWTPRTLMEEAKRLAPKLPEPPRETKKADSPALQELKAAWKKANKEDRKIFLEWIK